MRISRRRARPSGRAARCSRAPTRSCACWGPIPPRSTGADKGALLVGALDPLGRARCDRRLMPKAGLEALAMEWMPRITRAQSMDILSSQSNLAGYKAVIEAADAYRPRLSDDDDRGRHDQPGQGVRDGRRRRRACRRSRRRGGWAPRSAPPTCARRPGSRSCRSAPSRSSSRMSPASRAKGAGGYATEMSPEYQKAQAELVSEPHRQAGHRHHHRADPGQAGAAADQRRAARDDARRQRHRRPRGRGRRQCRGLRRRRERRGVMASRSSAPAIWRAACRPMRRRCSRATSTISSAPSGTRRRASRCFRTTTRWSRARA